MADVIQLERGASPWKPAATAELIREFAYYEVPTIGIVRQHGVNYLFHCVSNEDDQISVWHYVVVSDEMRQRLEQASSAEDFRAVVGEIRAGAGAIALCLEGAGILASRMIEQITRESVGSLVREMVEEVGDLLSGAENTVVLTV